MYKLTRQEAAEKLDISVRSVDRYIKAGKLRSKKKGKIVFINDGDIDNLSGKNSGTKHIIITEGKKKKKNKNYSGDSSDFMYEEESSKSLSKKDHFDKLTKTFETVYGDLRSQIEKKDDIIQKLSIQVGQSDEKAKNSISLTEYKRSQMLLEESKQNIAKEMDSLSQKANTLEQTLKDEKFDKKVLIIFVFVLLGLAAYFWFKSV